MDMDPFQEVKPSQSKRSWSITKKIYFFGFILWPIWIVGTIWICAKDKEKKRWSQRCLINSIIAIPISIYVIVSLVKTLS
ncbi:hypothetical protein G9A89_011221 [Geosiphon pyriformis]|nr:hypothetical protein G9A89_011221 [Geosiphon pyriformis]